MCHPALSALSQTKFLSPYDTSKTCPKLEYAYLRNVSNKSYALSCKDSCSWSSSQTVSPKTRWVSGSTGVWKCPQKCPFQKVGPHRVFFNGEVPPQCKTSRFPLLNLMRFLPAHFSSPSTSLRMAAPPLVYSLLPPAVCHLHTCWSSPLVHRGGHWWRSLAGLDPALTLLCATDRSYSHHSCCFHAMTHAVAKATLKLLLVTFLSLHCEDGYMNIAWISCFYHLQIAHSR